MLTRRHLIEIRPYEEKLRRVSFATLTMDHKGYLEKPKPDMHTCFSISGLPPGMIVEHEIILKKDNCLLNLGLYHIYIGI